jgi:outer membrane biosynthesis protein TonB
MRTGLTVSVIAHGILIALGVITLASTEPLDMNVEAVPVDLVKADDVTSLDKGLKTAAIKPDPAPNDPAPAPKDEVKPNPAPPKPKPSPTPPPPAPAPPEPQKPEPTPPPPAPEPAPKAAEAPPPDAAPAPTPDAAPIEEPKKVAMVPPKPRLRPEPPKAKPEPVKETAEVKPKPPAQQAPATEAKDTFDTDKIAALLDKTPTASAPAESHSEASLGVEKGQADAKMTQNELDALRAAVQRCWDIPQGWTDPREVSVTIRFSLNPDGSVSGTPTVIEFPASQYGQVAADNAIRAVLRCGPYQLPPQKYAQWSEVQLRFTPMG